MLSDLQRKDVWEGWIGGKIRANYFAAIGGRFQTEQKILTLMILLLSSGAAATFTAGWLPEWVKTCPHGDDRSDQFLLTTSAEPKTDHGVRGFAFSMEQTVE